MKLTDERCRALTGYLGECHHEGRMPINCGYRCVKCGDTYVANHTFTSDADMMALFRKMVDEGEWYLFENSILVHDKYQTTRNKRLSQKYPDGYFNAWLFYDPERFCNLVAEWLEVKK